MGDPANARPAPAVERPLLAIENLTVGFGRSGTTPPVLDNVSISLAAGGSLALLGESGSGKTTLALALTRLLPPPPDSYWRGAVRFEDADLLAMSERRLRERRGSQIGYIFQEPSASLNPFRRVGPQLAEVVGIHHPDLDRAAVRQRALDLLTEVGLPGPARRWRDFPGQWSGGMQQRLAIAMALAGQPRLLIADEPTTALDAISQRHIVNLLNRLQAQRGLALLLITHHFGLVHALAKRVAILHRGRIVEEGPVAEILSHPTHPYTRRLIAAVPRFRMTPFGIPTPPGGRTAASQPFTRTPCLPLCKPTD